MNGNECSLIESQNFFVVYNNTDSAFSTKREIDHSEDKFKSCNAEYVTYASMEAFSTDFPIGLDVTIGWTCQTLFEHFAEQYFWFILLTLAIVAFVINLLFKKKPKIANDQPLLESGK